MSIGFLALWAGLALAEPGIPGGEDLRSWHEINHRSDSRFEAYHAFLERWPSSALAEVAYGRLVDAGELDPAASRLGPYADIARSHDQHRQVRDHTVGEVIVAPLKPSGEPLQSPDSGVHLIWAVGALVEARPLGSFGLGVQTRSLAFVSRLSGGDGWTGSAALRASSPGTGVFGEVAARSTPGISVLAGGRLFVARGAWAELGLGLIREQDWTPVVRLELVQRQ